MPSFVVSETPLCPSNDSQISKNGIVCDIQSISMIGNGKDNPFSASLLMIRSKEESLSDDPESKRRREEGGTTLVSVREKTEEKAADMEKVDDGTKAYLYDVSIIVCIPIFVCNELDSGSQRRKVLGRLL